MHRIEMPIFKSGIKALTCVSCSSDNVLELYGDFIKCPNCQGRYRIVDGVIDFMPHDYTGYTGDSLEAAILRNKHNLETIREDTVHLRRMLGKYMPPGALMLDAGCGTGQIAAMLSASQPGLSVIAADASMAMCRLAAQNCTGESVLVVRTPSIKGHPMALRAAVFDIVHHRLAPMPASEAYRLLRPGGYVFRAGLVMDHWQEVREAFPKERLIRFPEKWTPSEKLKRAGFVDVETYEWRSLKTRPVHEIDLILRYAPVIQDYDTASDRKYLDELAAHCGNSEGVTLTEGQTLVIGRKSV